MLLGIPWNSFYVENTKNGWKYAHKTSAPAPPFFALISPLQSRFAFAFDTHVAPLPCLRDMSGKV